MAFVCSTTRSVETRRSAPSMAPTPVMSSSTPTLIGLPVGGWAAAPAGAGAPVGAAVVPPDAGAQAPRLQANTTITTAARWSRARRYPVAAELMLFLPSSRYGGAAETPNVPPARHHTASRFSAEVPAGAA